MTFGEPRAEPALDMNRFRRDLRLMWAMMRIGYRQGNEKFWKVPFPEMKTVEKRNDRRDSSQN